MTAASARVASEVAQMHACVASVRKVRRRYAGFERHSCEEYARDYYVSDVEVLLRRAVEKMTRHRRRVRNGRIACLN